MAIPKTALKKITDVLWEIPQYYQNEMRLPHRQAGVPARIYATESMLEEIRKDRSLEQLVNVTALPGIVGYALAMPDAHEGYGFPIGGVAATVLPDGVVSPGGIGYDINCGVRLLTSTISYADACSHIQRLAAALYQAVPSGVGTGGSVQLSVRRLNDVLQEGARWAVREGYGFEEDLAHTESAGMLKEADCVAVSERAKARGKNQLGTMGAGNHFVEVDRVAEIFDKETAQAFGLFSGQLVVLIHTGSRGLGHQVATDYIREMLGAMPTYGIILPDRELACAPLSAPEGRAYMSAMAAAANFAWANRQSITATVRRVWKAVFGRTEAPLAVLYDVAHNIAKIEAHEVGGRRLEVLVHRKGATRAFPPGHQELAALWQQTGQPVIIPGSMGTASYVLAGTHRAMTESFGTCAHGAGRRMSRSKARRMIRGAELQEQLRREGIVVESGSLAGLAEEAPMAYKDVHSVVDVVHRAGIARKIAELRPVAVMKG